MNVDEPRRLAPVSEAAAYSGLHHQTLRRYVKDGRLTGYRLGVKLLRVDLDEVDALIQPVKRAS